MAQRAALLLAALLALSAADLHQRVNPSERGHLSTKLTPVGGVHDAKPRPSKWSKYGYMGGGEVGWDINTSVPAKSALVSVFAVFLPLEIGSCGSSGYFYARFSLLFLVFGCLGPFSYLMRVCLVVRIRDLLWSLAAWRAQIKQREN